MREENGDIIIGSTRIPLQGQEHIFPVMLTHAPDSYQAIGIDWDNYSEFGIATRDAFVAAAFRSYHYPNAEEAKRVLVLDTVRIIDRLLSWIYHMKMQALLKAAFALCSLDEVEKVWRKMARSTHLDELARAIPMVAIPLILAIELPPLNELTPQARGILTNRLKEEK